MKKGQVTIGRVARGRVAEGEIAREHMVKRGHMAKGQAAIEYFMNYGWALLILAIIMSIISFTGVFNPNYFIMEECYAGPLFTCRSQLVSGTPIEPTKLYMNISNNAGYTINLTNITFTFKDFGGIPIVVSALVNQNLNSGNSSIITAIFPAEIKKGVSKKIYMNISHYICAEEVNPSCTSDPDFLRSVSGRIVAQAN
ncbi:MAG: hypothetical protein AB1391_03205 [Candidatus Micrarchaeota archaeon]